MKKILRPRWKGQMAALCCCAAVAVACFSCKHGGQEAAAGSALERTVDEAVRRCPLPVSDVGYVESITLDADTLAVTVTVTSPTINMDSLMTRGPSVKRVLGAGLPGLSKAMELNNDIIKLAADEGKWVSIIYQARGGSPRVKLDYSPDELAGAQKSDDDPESRLADEILMAQTHLPAPMDDQGEMTMTAVKDDGRNVVFTVIVEEAVAGEDALTRLKQNIAMVIRDMEADFANPPDEGVKILRDVCNKAGRGIVYNYIGSISDDTVTIAIPVEKLK